MKLAIAQTLPHAGDVEANMRRHVALAERAASAGATLVLFPELSLTGYELEQAASLAFELDDRRLDPLRRLADRSGLTIVAGAPMRVNGALHIAAPIARPGGLDVYTKRHLGAFDADANPGRPVPPPEASVFEAGDRDPPLTLGGPQARVGICADTARASHLERACSSGTDIYLASAFVIEADYAGDAARLSGYARDRALLVLLSNFGGPSGGLSSAGRSAAWSTTGERLCELPARGEHLAVIEHG